MLNPVLWAACRRSRRRVHIADPATVQQRRDAQARAARARPVPTDALTAGVVAVDRTIELPDRTLPVRVYRPREMRGAAPAHLFLHGGGFWGGSVEHSDPTARYLAAASGCPVFSLGYRLAPEHPWPAAEDDAYAALQWLASSADDLDVDPARISIGGVSAGASIAATTAIRVRDTGGAARLAFQLLEIPVVDLTQSSASMRRFATGYLATRAELAEGNEYYVPDPALRADPRVSPLLAPDLSGLPPAFVLTSEFDPLRDEGEAYAARLREAGVPVELVRARGHVHGSTNADVWYLPSARRYRRRAAEALRRAHGLNAVRTDPS